MTYEYSTSGDPNAFGALGAAFFFVYFLFIFGMFIYMAICLQKIAKKLGEENAWWAWIPVLNVLLIIKLAGKPLWWLLLLFVPLVNIIIAVLVWIAIAERLGKSAIWGILVFLPVLNLIAFGVMAFGKTDVPTSLPPQTPLPPQQPPIPPQQPPTPPQTPTQPPQPPQAPPPPPAPPMSQ